MAKSCVISYNGQMLSFTEGIDGVRSIQEKANWSNALIIKIWYTDNTSRTFYNVQAYVSDSPLPLYGFFPLLVASVTFSYSEINSSVRKLLVSSPSIDYSINPVLLNRKSSLPLPANFSQANMNLCFGDTPVNLGYAIAALPVSGGSKKFRSIPITSYILTYDSLSVPIDRSNSALFLQCPAGTTGGDGSHTFELYYNLINNMSNV